MRGKKAPAFYHKHTETTMLGKRGQEHMASDGRTGRESHDPEEEAEQPE